MRCSRGRTMRVIKIIENHDSKLKTEVPKYEIDPNQLDFINNNDEYSPLEQNILFRHQEQPKILNKLSQRLGWCCRSSPLDSLHC
ncbi:hypothetical protein EJB05_26473 [Eragrostis curvula]|uniref:Uncharacterized protein n=1 Tax=Eragrostis curvula TaxID=38414 RepID=A0A5J9ULD3_9POAL|nr:hypothetical protein EJB05_26473 [Eragrostis curvula]